MEQLPGPEQPRPFQAAFFTKQENRNCILADVGCPTGYKYFPHTIIPDKRVIMAHILQADYLRFFC